MTNNVKTTLHTAYEPTDSITVRLTPETIGELIAKCPDSDLHRIFDSLKEYTRVFSPKSRKELVNTFLK